MQVSKSAQLILLLSLVISGCQASPNSEPDSETFLAPATEISEDKAASIDDFQSSTSDTVVDSSLQQEVSLASGADTAEARGALAGLTSEQSLALLNTATETPRDGHKRQAIIIPGYLPQGFRVKEITTSSYATESQFDFYTIVYINDQNFCFSINHYQYEGPMGEGPFDVDEIRKVIPPKLGVEIEIGITRFSRESRNDEAVIQLWGDPSGDYLIYFPDVLHCENKMETSEIVKIVESLMYLDPKDDGHPLNVVNGVIIF